VVPVIVLSSVRCAVPIKLVRNYIVHKVTGW
jgi:hypothetical protein